MSKSIVSIPTSEYRELIRTQLLFEIMAKTLIKCDSDGFKLAIDFINESINEEA